MGFLMLLVVCAVFGEVRCGIETFFPRLPLLFERGYLYRHGVQPGQAKQGVKLSSVVYALAQVCNMLCLCFGTQSRCAPFLFLMATHVCAQTQCDSCSFPGVQVSCVFTTSCREHVSWRVCDSAVPQWVCDAAPCASRTTRGVVT